MQLQTSSQGQGLSISDSSRNLRKWIELRDIKDALAMAIVVLVGCGCGYNSGYGYSYGSSMVMQAEKSKI